jgi:hypothetical protein
MAKRKPPAKPPTRKPREQQTKAVFRGFLRYIQRPGASVREVWETEQIEDDDTSPYIKDVISLTAFQKSATDGSWKTRRDSHWQEVRQKVLTHIQTEAVKAEVAEIESLEALKTVALTHITGNSSAGIDAVKPKSLEGAIGAFVQLDKRIGDKRKIVAAETADAASTGHIDHKAVAANNTLKLSDGDLSTADIEVMARALASQRVGEADATLVNLPKVVTPAAEDA